MNKSKIPKITITVECDERGLIVFGEMFKTAVNKAADYLKNIFPTQASFEINYKTYD